jgi:glutamyl-tRNA reductase
VTVLLLGANHDTATVAVRECLTIPPERVAGTLRFLSSAIGEIALLTTCNRTEFYALNPQVAEPALRRFLHSHAHLPEGELDQAIYRLEGRDAIRHLFQVAGGLDSMVLGEPQILGQVREAWRTAGEAQSLGPVLDALFRAALNCGKLARAETGIARGGVSVSQAAVEFARERLGDFRGRIVLVVGAGETGALVARNLQAHGAGNILIANRTLERSWQLAGTLNGQAVRFERLTQALRAADIVISCTSAQEPVISRELLERAMGARPERPLLAIDIAVPRDIEPSAKSIPGLMLHDLDDLHGRISENSLARRTEAAAVEELVEQQVDAFLAWHASHAAGGTIRAVRERAEEIRQAHYERALRRMPGLDAAQQEALRIATEQLVNSLLHTPISQLRDPEHGPANAAYLAQLFGVEPGETQAPVWDDDEGDAGQSVA